MDPEDLAKKAVAGLFANAGIVADNVGQDNALAKSFRDKVTTSLAEQDAYEPFLEARLLTIHAWNPQTAALFFEGDHMVVTYKMQPDEPWQLAGVQDITTLGVDDFDIYDLQASIPMAKQMGGVVQDPRLFVYVDKDGNDTAAA